jgi:hypothetical protein
MTRAIMDNILLLLMSRVCEPGGSTCWLPRLLYANADGNLELRASKTAARRSALKLIE